jgi:methyl-accepting chemotaxis protein
MSATINSSETVNYDDVNSLRAALSVKSAMADNSPVNTILADRDLKIVYVNEASVQTLRTLEHLLPCKVNAIVGQSIDIFHKNPSYQRKLLANDKNLPHRATIELGEEKLDLLVSAIYDQKGEYLGPMVTWEVVTEKVKMETTALDNKNRLAAIDRCMAVIEFKLDGTILDANEAFCDTMGYTLNEIKGQHHSMFADPAFARSPEYKNFWAKLNRGEPEQGHFRRLGKGGKEVWIDAIYNPLIGADGKPYRVVKYATDITERLKAEKAAAEKAAIVQNAPLNIMLADLQGKIIYMNPASEKTLRSIEKILPVRVDEIVGGSYDIFHKNPAHQRRLLADPRNLPHAAQFEIGGETLALTASAIYDAQGTYVGPMVAWELVTERVAAAKREQENQERERLAQEDLRAKVASLLKVVNAAAAGDLTEQVTVVGEDAVGELGKGLRAMLDDLKGMIGQVVDSAAQFTEGSRVIAESSQSLAQGSQTQSSSVEEMSAAVEQLARSINAVKDNSNEADTVAKETSQLAEDGGAAVQKSVQAMELIKTSSEQISEIIQVISEIASQTNLLALNAAIEAARAGEHGLGFAVVADEVRKLAERSSEAAKEISSLIKESTKRVEEGASLSAQTGAALTKIIQGVEKTAKKISEIATSTVEQATNAKEVATAIQQIGQVTEQVAAGSEELASSSEELGAQANGLRELVVRFKLNR